MTHTILILFKEQKVNPVPRRRRRRFGSLDSASASVRFVGFGVDGVSVACFLFSNTRFVLIFKISVWSFGTVVTVSHSLARLMPKYKTNNVYSLS